MSPVLALSKPVNTYSQGLVWGGLSELSDLQSHSCIEVGPKGTVSSSTPAPCAIQTQDFHPVTLVLSPVSHAGFDQICQKGIESGFGGIH